MKHQEDYLRQLMKDIGSGRVYFEKKQFNTYAREELEQYQEFCKTQLRKFYEWERISYTTDKEQKEFDKLTDARYLEAMVLRSQRTLIGTSQGEVDQRLTAMEIDIKGMKSDIKNILLRMNMRPPAEQAEQDEDAALPPKNDFRGVF